MLLKKIFCNHVYLRSVSCHSERVGDHNYVYNYEHYECEKCKKRYIVKILSEIEKNYYTKFTKENTIK